MAYTPQGIKLTPTGGYTYSVTLTYPGGSSVTAYTARDGSSTHTFPVSVGPTDTVEFWLAKPGQVVVSATVNGEEVAGRNGATATVNVDQASVFSGALSVDSEESAGASGSGTSGALTVIQRITIAAPTATIDFTSIPATYQTLIVDWSGRTNAAATATEECRARLNNDSGANYYYHCDGAGSNAGYVQSGTATAYTRIGRVTAVDGTANFRSSGKITIPNYADTTFTKTGFNDCVIGNTTAAAATNLENGGFVWNNTAAVSRITLFGAAGSWIAGSVATLYGVAGA